MIGVIKWCSLFFLTSHLFICVTTVFIKHDYCINKCHPLSPMYILHFLWHSQVCIYTWIDSKLWKKSSNSNPSSHFSTGILIIEIALQVAHRENLILKLSKNPSITYVQYTAQEHQLFQIGRMRSSKSSVVAGGSSLLTPRQPVRQRCRLWAEKWRHLAVLRLQEPLQLSLWGSPSSPVVGVAERKLMIWGPPLLNLDCQGHPVRMPVSLPLASVPPTLQPPTVQQTLSSSTQALVAPMGGGSRQRDPSWGRRLSALQASSKEVILVSVR